MGQSYTFKCTKCDYEVESSGKKDWGMIAVVEPYICNDCREVRDVRIGEYGKEIFPEDLSKGQEKDYYRCHHCGGKNITKWNTQTKPCPKCGSRMKKDPSTIIYWD
jgi:DNA-directed RNA polymerase subunit RPC12/RpoP